PQHRLDPGRRRKRGKMMPAPARAVQRWSAAPRMMAREVSITEGKEKGDIGVITASFLHADVDAELPSGAIQRAPKRWQDGRGIGAASRNDLAAIRRMIEGNGARQVVCICGSLHEPLCRQELVEVDLLSNRACTVIR